MNVYLISAQIDDSIFYKIGYTRRDVIKRIKEFKTGNVSDFEIVCSYKTKWASKVEANLKNRFSIYNINGEWFNLPVNEINNFYDTCDLIHKNFEFLSKNNTWIIDNNKLI